MAKRARAPWKNYATGKIAETKLAAHLLASGVRCLPRLRPDIAVHEGRKMPQAVTFLVQRARITRQRAHRVRLLARKVGDPEIADRLTRYAGELEERARILEERADGVKQHLVKTKSLAREVQGFMIDLRDRVQKMVSGTRG